MSVHRSLTRSLITYGNSNCAMATSSTIIGGSQPELRENILSQLDMPLQTFRQKRKQPDEDFSTKFEEFENRVLAVLTSMATTQTENLKIISQDVSLIKDQVMQMKLTTDHLVVEQSKLKEELVNIANFNVNTEQKIKLIERDISSLKASTVANGALHTYDSMISEIHERSLREKNLIICGIDELYSKDQEDRRSHDMNEIKKVLKSIIPDCAEPVKIIRLGKYDVKKTRPIKACFATSESPRLILRNKSNATKGTTRIKFFSDETPYQKKAMQNLRDDLKQRVEAGEKDLTIKFIKGVPKVTTITASKY